MIIADNFTCEIPTEGAAFIECAMPAPGLIEWMTALGTAGATLAAVCFGIVEVVRSRKERERRKLENDRQVLNIQFQKITGIMRELEALFPLNAWADSDRYISQLAIYQDLLEGSREVPNEIKRLASSLFARFGQIAFAYSVYNSQKTKEIVQQFKPWNSDMKILPGIALSVISIGLESGLSAWHLTGKGEESVISDLLDLERKVDSFEKMFSDYEESYKGNPE